MSENQAKTKDDELLEIARRRFAECEDAEQEIRREALDDLENIAGKQWPEQILNQRRLDGRPYLTINKLPTYTRQVVNEMRQNRPSIKVYPVDSGADIGTAKVLNGLIRNIEQSSNAEVAYNIAGEGAVQKSFGFFRIITEFLNPKSFKRVIKIKSIENHFAVYLDHASRELDGSDSNYGFIFEEKAKEEIQRLYPDLKDFGNDWGSLARTYRGWFTDDNMVRIAEYYYKDYEKKTIYLLVDGSTTEEKPINELLIQDKRETEIPVIKWCKIIGNEILERGIFDSQFVPIIPVYGNVLNVNGKRKIESLIRHSKDSQRMYNYMKSNEAEAISLAPKAPYIAAEGQIPKEYRHQWETSNTKTYGVLTYKPITIGGSLAPAPQRNSFEPAIGAITQAGMLASDDIKATTGIYDAAMGARSNEISGRAITARKLQAENSNYHFIDNQAISIRHAGRILLDLIPKTYDIPDMIRIIGEDGSQDMVKVNQEYQKGLETVKHDLTVGTYDVVVDVGPSYQTKRQESADLMLQLTKTLPQIAPVISDLLVRNLDIPQSQEMADRIKRTLPPNVVADQSDGKIPMHIQQQMQQQAQIIEALTKEVNQFAEEHKTKRMDIEAKERIEVMKLQMQEKLALAKISAGEAELMFKADIEQLNRRLDQLDYNEEFDSEDFKEPVENGLDEAQQNNEQGILE